MAEAGPARKYEMSRRAEDVEGTRRRIVEAAIELHADVGPARTTIAGIASQAGVQRHTVYRHFPSEDGLLAACSAHYWRMHPFPDVKGWERIQAPRERTVAGLSDLYRFYSTVAPMLSNVLRDAGTNPAVADSLQSYTKYTDTSTEVLLAGYAPFRADRRVEAAVRHAQSFSTWHSLIRVNGLQPTEAVALMVEMINAASGLTGTDGSDEG